MSSLTAAFNLALRIEGKRGGGRGSSYFARQSSFDITFNPAALVERTNTESTRRQKERTLSATDINRLWVDLHNGVIPAPFCLMLSFLLTTGQRVEEVVHATWDEFDFQRGVWNMDASRRKVKGTGVHEVPLEPLHIGILTEAKTLSGKSQYVFPARDGKGHINRTQY